MNLRRATAPYALDVREIPQWGCDGRLGSGNNRLILVSCPINTLLDPPADFRAGQGAPTRHSGHYGEEAQRVRY